MLGVACGPLGRWPRTTFNC